MPRIRSVHPDLHRDRTLAQTSASAERTFVRLWCHLDDDGRGEDDPDLLKADLYPRHRDMTPDAIEADLQELAKLGLIVRYRVDGVPYLACKPETWSAYQRPQKKQDSKLPGIDQADPEPDPDGTATEPVRDRSATATRPVAPVGEGRGEEREKEDGAAVAPHDWPRVVNDGTFTDRVIAWARSNGYQRQCVSPAERTRWALDLAGHHLGGGNRYHGAAAELVVEWVEQVADERLSLPARKHLVRLLKAEGPLLTFRAMETAVTSGAGLSEAHADDPQAMVKFANACVRRWRAEGGAA